MNIESDKLLDTLGIPIVHERNYWMVRSNSGRFFQDFIFHDYIALSWDYITIKMLTEMKEDRIKEIIEENENEAIADVDEDISETSQGKITAIYNKLHRFVSEMKIGDVVVLPSQNSDNIQIGLIVGDVYEDYTYAQTYYEENGDSDIIPCTYAKRRKIKWQSHMTKSNMDLYLVKAFNSHHALSNINEYAPYINRNIFSMYRKDNEVHSTLYAGHENGLSLKELAILSTYLDGTVNDIANTLNIDIPDSDIQVKLNIHSPGLIEIISLGVGSGLAVAIIMFAWNHIKNGGTFKVGFKKDTTGNIDFAIESETKGLRGYDLAFKELELKKMEIAAGIIKDLNINSPEIIAAVVNGDAISTNMIEDVQNQLPPEN